MNIGLEYSIINTVFINFTVDEETEMEVDPPQHPKTLKDPIGMC